MRPYASSQRALDEALVESVRRLAVQLEAHQAAMARARYRAARQEARIAELESRLEALLVKDEPSP
jgi:transcription elongation GreA/GreB family factor